MKKDITRVVIVVTLSGLIGLVSGYFFLFLSIGLLFCVVWYIKNLNNLLVWMKRGNSGELPEYSGLLDDLSRQYEDLRIRHKKRKKKLANYLRRFKETTLALPDGIVVLGANEDIEWANEKAEHYLGIHHAQDIGQRISNLIRHPSLVNFLKASKEQDDGELCVELVSPVNKDIHLELRLVSFGKAGQLLVARDITDIHRINRIRSDFIANASHELRTPLTVISGYLESFEDEFGGDNNSVGDTRIRQMRSQTERMRRLIEDLLKLSSLETSDELTYTEPVRIPDLLAQIADEAKTISGKNRHKIIQEIDTDLWVEGDRNQLHSAISNVVNNAVQHTPENGTITIRWFCQDDQGVLEISDTGEGIAPEHISRITERFYRVDRGRSREKGGTGLGLAIVKHILVKHKARLEIESEFGRGSTFRFRFPNSLIIRKDIISDRKATV